MDNIKDYVKSLNIDDIPWHRMVTAYETAEKYPEYLAILDSMRNIDEMNKALDSVSDFEHQSTLYTPAPFVLVFLVRIYEKAKNKNTPETEWLVNQLNKCFKYYLEVCTDADNMEHAEPLENMSDILNDKYLLPEGVNLYDYDDEDEFEELNEKLFSEDLFYSLYYYTRIILKEVI